MAAKKTRPVGRPPSPEGPMIPVTLRFHPKLVKRIARLCKRLGLTRSVLMRELVEGKLQEEGL